MGGVTRISENLLTGLADLTILIFRDEAEEESDFGLGVGAALVFFKPTRHAALNFLFPRAFQPLFGHNWVEVTREAAKDAANAFNSLVFRGEDRARARRFILQCVVAMFAEDIGLLPQDLFTRLLDECQRGASSYDLIGGLFRQMNDPTPARAGRYAGMDYFNGGLFATVDAIELQPPELGPLFAAAKENNWSHVQPVIFGTLFEGSLGKEERHALGSSH